MSEKATASRKIHFTSKGGGYSAIWMGSRGDLYQEFETVSGGATKYYPDFSASPITMNLTVTSARTNGVITPANVTYFANGVQLTFNTSRACTNAGLGSVFALDADGNLKIIGNLGTVNSNGNFLLAAEVSVSATSGSDVIHVSAPVTLSPYNGGDYARVTIFSPDGKNFTISEKGGSCKLEALTTKGGTEVTSGLTYEWYKVQNGSFVSLGVTTKTLTVEEKSVDTYGMYKVVVKENGVELGHDIQQVLDASDPYDILISSKIFTGTGNEVTTNDLELNDEMPDTAYLIFTCNFVKRGQNTAVNGTASYTFTLVAGNGAKIMNIPALTGAANQCKVTVADLNGWGIGDYELIVDGEISAV